MKLLQGRRRPAAKADAESYKWFSACAEAVTFGVGAMLVSRSEIVHPGAKAPNPTDRAATVALGLRSIAQLLQTPKTSVPAPEKVVRSALLIPIYTALSLVLRARTWVGRMIPLLGRTSFGAVLPCRVPDIIGTYIWVFQEWEPDLTRFIASRVGPGDVFVDVGANIGYYTLLAARSMGAGGCTVAVEASPAMFDELRRNVAADEFGDHVRLVNKAAAAEPGTLTVFAGPSGNAGMTTTLATRGLNVESTVEAMRLDQMLTPAEIASIRLIKIDVEGAEPDVLAGMGDLIASLRPDAEIVVELSPQWWPDTGLRPIDVLRPFIDAGFNVYEMKNSYTAWRYLWPNDVIDPPRVRGDLTERVERLEVVLSRYDGDYLPIRPEHH
ncbi:FkbM family methyltransferase [Mycobacterium crocinum]|uniref:FkbM family methyltransferase n=1 Tax=Mycolicibacterium crocinum TaxID=388459 RepID=A0ABY3TJ45_9MYCO|nr:FkbM family methyltransferase [Mycolicibacterium crocinum]MCV7214194.1 FkbM family methyltransferase [Mycolicibacterium crocinum]ULN39268.1 FkbM family methyltransferase [Mycolicibacterium crocinum]